MKSKDYTVLATGDDKKNAVFFLTAIHRAFVAPAPALSVMEQALRLKAEGGVEQAADFLEECGFPCGLSIMALVGSNRAHRYLEGVEPPKTRGLAANTRAYWEGRRAQARTEKEQESARPELVEYWGR